MKREKIHTALTKYHRSKSRWECIKPNPPFVRAVYTLLSGPLSSDSLSDESIDQCLDNFFVNNHLPDINETSFALYREMLGICLNFPNDSSTYIFARAISLLQRRNYLSQRILNSIREHISPTIISSDVYKIVDVLTEKKIFNEGHFINILQWHNSLDTVYKCSYLHSISNGTQEYNLNMLNYFHYHSSEYSYKELTDCIEYLSEKKLFCNISCRLNCETLHAFICLHKAGLLDEITNLVDLTQHTDLIRKNDFYTILDEDCRFDYNLCDCIIRGELSLTSLKRLNRKKEFKSRGCQKYYLNVLAAYKNHNRYSVSHSSTLPLKYLIHSDLEAMSEALKNGTNPFKKINSDFLVEIGLPVSSSLLLIAIHLNDLLITDLLLKNIEDKTQLPFETLCYAHSPEMIKLLSKHKVNLSAQNHNGDTLLHLLLAPEKIHEKLPLIDALLETRASLYLTNHKNIQPQNLITQSEDIFIELMEKLLHGNFLHILTTLLPLLTNYNFSSTQQTATGCKGNDLFSLMLNTSIEIKTIETILQHNPTPFTREDTTAILHSWVNATKQLRNPRWLSILSIICSNSQQFPAPRIDHLGPTPFRFNPIFNSLIQRWPKIDLANEFDNHIIAKNKAGLPPNAVNLVKYFSIFTWNRPSTHCTKLTCQLIPIELFQTTLLCCMRKEEHNLPYLAPELWQAIFVFFAIAHIPELKALRPPKAQGVKSPRCQSKAN